MVADTYCSFFDVYRVSMSSLGGASQDGKYPCGKYLKLTESAFSIVLEDFRRRVNIHDYEVPLLSAQLPVKQYIYSYNTKVTNLLH